MSDVLNTLQRQYIVFVGQLPYDVTEEAVKEHFQKNANLGDKVLKVRLLTHKDVCRVRQACMLHYAMRPPAIQASCEVLLL
jgi:RNA recognition motif-containing protein